MSDGVHLSIPFAACRLEGCREAAVGLKLPRLQRLLARLEPSDIDIGEAASLSPPHERVLAAASGLSAPDGCIPWAAWQVQQDGGDADRQAWAWITPCHWNVATDHIVMQPPQELRFDGEESQTLLTAMQPFFAQDGIVLQPHGPSRWLARGELFRDLATASLDRVSGRDIAPWVPRAAAAGPLRRLQQEMQMLLYTHPVNDERTRRGLVPVNSFWASGTGALPAAPAPAPAVGLLLPQGLRDAALLQDWATWAAAWQEIDRQQCNGLLQSLERGQPVTLTLCGDANARSWSGRGGGLWQRLRGALRPQPIERLLDSL
jgi:hypothetical protein